MFSFREKAKVLRTFLEDIGSSYVANVKSVQLALVKKEKVKEQALIKAY